MKDFIKKFQKDLNKLQQTIQKEGDDLVRKFKSKATKEKLMANVKEIEKLVETKVKKFEPALDKFIGDIKKSAKNAGIDLDDLEKKVKSNFKTARTNLDAKAKKVKAKAKKVKTKAKAKVKAKVKTRKPKKTVKKTVKKKAAKRKKSTARK